MGFPLIMDVDTGIDDAMALALAHELPGVDLIAVTTVAGNVPIELATDNTLRVLDWLSADVPVYRGMSQPLSRTLHVATKVHGNDGLGGWQEPIARRDVESLTAPEAIIQIAQQHQGEIHGVFAGPLTNLAVALSLEPRITEWFRHVTIMGGAFFNPGNVTADAEFNIFVDPEAAANVARSSLKCTWIGLDVTHQVAVTRDIWHGLGSASSPAAQLVREVCRSSIEERKLQSVYLHDPLAVAVAAIPDLVSVNQGTVQVDVGNVARGETRLISNQGTSKVAASVDSGRFVDIFWESLRLHST